MDMVTILCPKTINIESHKNQYLYLIKNKIKIDSLKNQMTSAVA